MAINKKLITFATRTNFDTQLANEEILNTSIVFIQDTQEIWTHGKFFGGLYSGSGTQKTTLKIGNTSKDLSLDGHTHSYLPLTGGTLTGSSYNMLELKRSTANGSSILFSNSSVNLGKIGFITSGNLVIGAGTATDGTANMLSITPSGVAQFYGNISTSGLVTGTGFSKTGATDAHVLLGSGGHKSISDFNASLVTSTTTSGTTNVVTSNTNTYLNIVQGGASVGSSTQIVGSNGVTVASDATGKLTITGLGAHAGIYSSRANGLGASSNSIEVIDARSINPLPNTDLQRGVWFDFKTNSAIGLTGASTYSSVITMVPYGDNSGNSNTSFRLAQSGNNLYFQNWTTVWGTWNKLWHSGNLANGTTAQYIRGDGSLATYTDTTYSLMTAAEATTGTATTARTISAKVLADEINRRSDLRYLSLAGGTLTGTITAPKILINKAGNVASGISWYNSTYTAWQDYMANSGSTGNGVNANITAPSGTLVTAWARRSFIEGTAGYGWTFEKGTSSATTPLVVAEIRASDGAAKFGGNVTAPTFTGALSGNASSATALTTNAGSVTQPVYFSGGKPVAATAYASASVNYATSAGTATNATNATKVNNNLILKFDTGTTEGTSLYTFNGSSAKTIDIKAGSNVSISKAAGIITISSTDNNTTYNAATSSTLGLSKLFSDTVQSVDANTVTTTASRTYGVQVNSSGQMVVNVPWVDTNTTYSAASDTVAGLVKIFGERYQSVAPSTASATANRTYLVQKLTDLNGLLVVNVPWVDTNTTYSLATTSTLGLVKLGSDTQQTVAAAAVTATASRSYAVQVNSSGQMVVNVPWVDTNTTYSDFVGGTSSVTGTAGLVPAPTTANYTYFLKGTGAWTQVNYSDLAGTVPTWNQSTTGSAGSVKSNATTGLLQIIGPAAGTTRVMTTPDANFSVADLGSTQTFSGAKTFLAEAKFSAGLRINNGDGTGVGIALYSGSSAVNPTYGITFAQQGYLGVHGAVNMNGLSANWATYFTMSADTGRGWIFTTNASSSGGNVASISNTGVFTGSDFKVGTSSVLYSGGALGTPSSGTLTNCTFPTLNQNTTGYASSVKSNSTTGVLQVSGPTAGTTRVMTTPDANFTAAALNLDQTFSGTKTFTLDTYFTGGLRVNQTNGAGIGISLYGLAASNPTYGLMFAVTSSKGTHGSVTGDWATYFTMTATEGRGWIFTTNPAGTTGNVASVSNTGVFTGSDFKVGTSSVWHSGNLSPVTTGSSQVISGSKTFSSAGLFKGGLSVNQTDGSGIGISLYSTGARNPTHGLMLATTANKGTHGAVTGNWATYFSTDASTGRGWIFTTNPAGTTGNVASISNTGKFYCSEVVSSGDVTAYSDISFKKNIVTITDAVNKVQQLRGVYYERKDYESGKKIGVIAQEIEKILPEVVNIDNAGVRSVAYGNIVGLLIEAIKEQQEEINNLKSTVYGDKHTFNR